MRRVGTRQKQKKEREREREKTRYQQGKGFCFALLCFVPPPLPRVSPVRDLGPPTLLAMSTSVVADGPAVDATRAWTAAIHGAATASARAPRADARAWAASAAWSTWLRRGRELEMLRTVLRRDVADTDPATAYARSLVAACFLRDPAALPAPALVALRTFLAALSAYNILSAHVRAIVDDALRNEQRRQRASAAAACFQHGPLEFSETSVAASSQPVPVPAQAQTPAAVRSARQRVSRAVLASPAKALVPATVVPLLPATAGFGPLPSSVAAAVTAALCYYGDVRVTAPRANVRGTLPHVREMLTNDHQVPLGVGYTRRTRISPLWRAFLGRVRARGLDATCPRQ